MPKLNLYYHVIHNKISMYVSLFVFDFGMTDTFNRKSPTQTGIPDWCNRLLLKRRRMVASD